MDKNSNQGDTTYAYLLTPFLGKEVVLMCGAPDSDLIITGTLESFGLLYLATHLTITDVDRKKSDDETLDYYRYSKGSVIVPVRNVTLKCEDCIITFPENEEIDVKKENTKNSKEETWEEREERLKYYDEGPWWK